MFLALPIWTTVWHDQSFLAVPRFLQSHRRLFGSANNFGSATDFAVPPVTVWQCQSSYQCHGFSSVTGGCLAVPLVSWCYRRQFGSDKVVGSSTALGMPPTAVWQCHKFWQCNGFCSPSGDSLAVSKFLALPIWTAVWQNQSFLAVPRTAVWHCQSFWECQGLRSTTGGCGSADLFASATEFAVPPAAVQRCQSSWQYHVFGSATQVSLALPSLAVPRTAVWQCQSFWQYHGFGNANVLGSVTDGSVKVFGSATDLAVQRTAVQQCQTWKCHGIGSGLHGSLAVPILAVPRTAVWLCYTSQCHGFGSATDGSFGSANFCSAMDSAVHGRQFGSVKLGSAEDLSVPLTAAWQCQIWHFHGFGSATDGCFAVPNSAVQWIWQCHGWQFGGAKFWQCHGFGSATYGRLAVRNLAVPQNWQCHGRQFGSVKFGNATHLAVPRTAVWQCEIWQFHGFGSASDGSLAEPNLAVPQNLQCHGRQFGSAQFGIATDLAVPRTPIRVVTFRIAISNAICF